VKFSPNAGTANFRHFKEKDMRISSGTFKGRKIGSRKAFRGKAGDELRPTSAKVREAIFDILRNDISGAVFLDLYAGTGTVALEALSRGAKKAYLVESNPVRYRALNETIDRLGLQEKASSFREEALRFLSRAAGSGIDFDIIFADPPYASGETDNILPSIDRHDILKAGGCLIVEHPSRKPPTFIPLTVKLVKSYRYGDTSLTLYRKEP
jgi:16S rRNA (guanine966-N2)-methyltransferase